VSDAATVRAAATATFAAGSARVRQAVFFWPPEPELEFPRLVGVTDLARRAVLARVEGGRSDAQLLFADGAWVRREAGAGWLQWRWGGRGVERGNPLWAIAVLEYAHRARREDDRSFHCEVEMVRLPVPLRGRTHHSVRLVGRVWVDEAGRISRATTASARPRRRRLRSDDDPLFWTTVDLWDFGADIGRLPAPEPQPRPWAPAEAVRTVALLVRGRSR
jgi:hypothetical protein